MSSVLLKKRYENKKMEKSKLQNKETILEYITPMKKYEHKKQQQQSFLHIIIN